MKNKLLLFFVIAFLFYGCAGAPVRKDTESKEEPAQKPSVSQQEQEMMSREAFNEILQISSSAEREEILPEMERKYLEIIGNYPDAPLAQESYYRLISIFLLDYYPPEFQKAEAHYADFLRKYPGSKFRYLVDLTLGTSYYKSKQWDKLLALVRPAYDNYLKKGSAGSPSLLFMFAEANFNLGFLDDAEAGYHAVVRLFPNFGDGVQSRARLNEISSKRKTVQ
ncbi:MAG: hypothetical protein HY809_09905 [Nitrospirae bacterium]|nr:hypothetical protein [Nitrospirota bacterium]